MLILISSLLICLTVLLIIPVAVFAIECLMAARHPNAASHALETAAGNIRPTITVVIPAHNEESGIGKTVDALMSELSPQDAVIVVADNCTDLTAEIAAARGARVLKRNDTEKRGKGYALDFAVQHLRQDPPEAVVFIDADCRLSKGALNLLGSLAVTHQRPVQARNQMNEPAGVGERSIAGFAWLVRGTIRPIGLAAMDMPCQLYGTGMAFPWTLLRDLSLASSNIVEDMKLTVDLIARGTMPLFCSDASVISSFAPAPDSATAQRQRWEHGHLATLFKYGLPAVARAIRALDMRKTMLALDICVPPLSLLVMLLMAGSIASVLAAPVVGAARYAVFVYLIAWAVLWASLGIASRTFGGGVLSLKNLLRIAAYAASKAPLYLKFLTGRQKEWNRTERK